MKITIRRMHDKDARCFLEVHHAAVREIAANDYPKTVIEDWAPLPVTEENLSELLDNPENEIRLVAEMEGDVVGIGALVLEKNELRACYVAPNATRKGVGTALVREIESIARTHGLERLQLDSSVTAEPFYLALNYKISERGEHIRYSGLRMACIKMEKFLSSR